MCLPCTQPHFQKGNNQGLTLYIAVPIEFADEGPWGTAKADKGWYSWLEKLGVPSAAQAQAVSVRVDLRQYLLDLLL